MDMEDKLSIKNILFTKRLPNRDIPAPVNGHKIFSCIDCGDKFMFESSYNDHISRKSVQITYMCRFCNQTKIFFNRCRLLYHIRSHAFKTATINVSDLQVEPIPLSFYKTKPIQKQSSNTNVVDLTRNKQANVCYECKKDIPAYTGAVYKDRASHFMQYTNEVYSCPVCLFALPTVCGLRAHMRFHLNLSPYFCSECGVHLPTKKVSYPYGHDCEGFKMMRATARLKCPVSNCHLFHPNDFKEHMKESHLKKVYKCSFCVVACFNEVTMNNHLVAHNVSEGKALIFYQCELCPGKLVVQNNVDNHMRTHINASIFPCWVCGCTYKEVSVLIDHHIEKHESKATIAIKNMLRAKNLQIQRIYRVVKRCEHCNRNFTYKCSFKEISVLPSECPYKCTPKSNVDTEALITCHLCKVKISQNWELIKKHYAINHKMYKCLDIKVVLQKLDVTKYKKRKRRVRNPNARKATARKRKPITKSKGITHKSVKPVPSDKEITRKSANPVSSDEKMSKIYCAICKYTCASKEQLEIHFISHKDPCSAYQCLECGQSFVVKPSFSTHLMIEHGISDAQEYILDKNKCYNENALEKYQNTNISFEPLKDNQCKICREQFENSEDLTKHFRGHGMAFLLKSTSSKNIC